MKPTPLYRRVNTKARGVAHISGADYRHERNTKPVMQSDSPRQSMHGKVQRGLRLHAPFSLWLLNARQGWPAYAFACLRGLSHFTITFQLPRAVIDQRLGKRLRRVFVFAGTKDV